MRPGADAIPGAGRAGMRLLAADLRVTGSCVPTSATTPSDLLWSMNSPEYFELLRSRGWSPTRYAEHLADLWSRHLLDS